jgi:hypothetical protein
MILVGIFGADLMGTQTQDISGALKRPIHSEEKKLLTSDEAFHASLVIARAPGGMVRIVTCDTKLSVREWQADGKTLEETLNGIVAGDRKYRWELQNESVNLLPTSGEPVLLQTHIDKFHMTTASSLEPLNFLMQQNAVKAEMENLHLKGGLTIINYLSTSREFVIDFKGGTLREALNAIAVANGTDIWQYKETHCGDRNEVSIKF